MINDVLSEMSTVSGANSSKWSCNRSAPLFNQMFDVQAKNSVSAQAMQLESQFRESEMQQMEQMEQVGAQKRRLSEPKSKARAEADAFRRRAQVAETELHSAQAAAVN